MISTMWLFVIGGALLLCELFVFSYFLLFIGVGVLLTGLLTLAGIFAGSLAWQLASIIVCSIAALFVLRPLLKRFAHKGESYTENANLQLKIGAKARVVEHGIIECNGTMWKCDTTGFETNEVATIADFKDGAAVISKIK